LKRLSEVLSAAAFLYAGDASVMSTVRTENMQRLRLMTAIETATIKWLNDAQLQTLGQTLLTKSIAIGDFFTYFGPVSGKGVPTAATQYSLRKPIKAEPRLKIDLSPFAEGASMTIQVHPENYTASSSAGEMSGKKRLFLVGRITEAEFPELRAQAYLIGHLHNEYRPEGESDEGATRVFRDPFDRLHFQMEVYLSNVSPFDRAVNESSARTTELTKLQSILESDVKHAFAEILGEAFVPKDSPSETSDLQTTRLRLSDQQVSAVIAFKGRGLPKPLTVANSSKHGNQISKLFSEPAELVIFQHCHKVTSHFRNHMRAFATRTGHLKPFLIIDGNDTVRILRHFKKLGFS
jgi:hypothetical protein